MNWKTTFTLAVALFAAVALSQPGGGGGQGRGQGRMGGGMRGGGMMGLLNRSDVQSELKLTNEQKDKLNALRPQRGQGGPGGGGQPGGGGGQGQPGGGGGQPGGGFDREAMMKRQQEQEAKIAEILDDAQEKRLKELVVQREGLRVAMNPSFAKELSITADQQKAFEALQEKQRNAQMQMMERMRNQEITREDMMAASQNNQKILEAEIGKILTQAQKDKLESMKGAPFKFDEGGGN